MSGLLLIAGRLVLSGAAGLAVGYAGWGLANIVDAPNTFPLWWFVEPAVLIGIATWVGYVLAPREATGRWTWRRVAVMALRSGGAIGAIGLVCGVVTQQALSHPRELGDASSVLAAVVPGVAFVYAAFAAGRLTGTISAAAGVVPGILTSTLGIGLAVFCGLICGVGAGLMFAATYVDPCDVPGRHLYCLDPGRWGLFPGIVVAGLVLGAWLSAAVGLTLMTLWAGMAIHRRQAETQRLPA